MEKLRMSPAEILKMVEIKPIEMECLDRVFNYLGKFSPLLGELYVLHNINLCL